MDDLVNAIAYEVKLEIASRYFGFRTAIEAETGQYLARLEQARRERLNPIHLDILRLQVLLSRERLIHDFLPMVNLPATLAEKQAVSLADSQLFAGLSGEGFTRWWRYQDLGFTVYRSLVNSIASYRQTFLDLSEEYDEICIRIDEFHRNNDLTGILDFLRTFDAADYERSKFLHNDPGIRFGKSLDHDLRIPHPRPVTDLLPDLPAIPPLRQLKSSLSGLLRSAYDSPEGTAAALPV